MSSRFSVIDLSRMAPLTVITSLAYEAILARRMLRVKEQWSLEDPPLGVQYDVESLEFDPIKIQQEVDAFFQLLLEDRINQAARATTLAFASGTDIDAIASRFPGGVPRQAGETDERYRRRVLLAANALSTAGAEEAYVFQALSAEPTLSDATAIARRISIDDPRVIVTCLSERPEMIPTAAELARVRSRLYDPGVRPLTDVVSVQPANIVHANYRLRVKLFPGPDASLMLGDINTAINGFLAVNRRLGADHMRSAIFDAAVIPGVYDVVIEQPAADILINPTQVVRVESREIQIVGRGE